MDAHIDDGRQQGRVEGLAERVGSLALPERVLLALVLLGIVAALDVATGSELSFSIFYLVPVALAGAFISRRAGAVFGVLGATVWGYLEVTTGRPYSAAWIPVWNTLVRLGFFLLVNELIARLRQTHESVRALARNDSLTGIPNGRVFEEYAGRVIALSRRNGRPFTVAYVDLDHFKQVNDRYGHSEGDAVLRATAALIAECVRSSDVVARLGGDEFGLVMPDTGREQAQATLQRVFDGVTGELAARWGVGATIGAVTFLESPVDVDFAVHEADTLMYRGKAAGRGRVLQSVWPDALEGGD